MCVQRHVRDDRLADASDHDCNSFFFFVGVCAKRTAKLKKLFAKFKWLKDI